MAKLIPFYLSTLEIFYCCPLWGQGASWWRLGNLPSGFTYSSTQRRSLDIWVGDWEALLPLDKGFGGEVGLLRKALEKQRK